MTYFSLFSPRLKYLTAGFVFSLLFLFSSSKAEYKGRLTCKNLEHFRTHTNDTRFIPFCNDTSKACVIHEKLEELPSCHPLRAELELKLEEYLNFHLGLCEAAIMTYAPQLYKEELAR